MRNLQVYLDSDDKRNALIAEWQNEDANKTIERMCFASKPHFSPAAITISDLQHTVNALLYVISKQERRIAELEKIVYYNYEEKHDE